tara:strand:- start:120 stop:581 length:462 start_codon:yes stop_codon:yes gene_type:complete
MYDKTDWGNTIWYLFHTLIHNVDSEKFINVVKDFEYVIKNVTANLPCPECAKEATDIIKKLNFSNITKKDELKLLLFNFHNKINLKLKKNTFDLSDLDNKYEKANFKIIHNNFNLIFSQNTNNNKLMNNSFNRNFLLKNINNSINNIVNNFKL